MGEKLTSGIRSGRKGKSSEENSAVKGVKNAGLVIGQILKTENYMLKIRLDWEPEKGLHYNIEKHDFTFKKLTKYIVHIEGVSESEDEELVKNYSLTLTKNAMRKSTMSLKAAEKFIEIHHSTDPLAINYKETIGKMYTKILKAAQQAVESSTDQSRLEIKGPN